jgi:hypothetical protein
MLQRHQTTCRNETVRVEAIELGSRLALWKSVRRDPRFLHRSAQTVERLALRLHRQAGRAKLRADHAQELKLPNLTAADAWWKRQWQEAEGR